MRFLHALAIAAFGALALAPVAPAQSTDFMLNECSTVGQTYFRDFNARTDMRYNGQRVDGTHAINGRIYLENRSAEFACSYERGGRRMVEFFADGRVRNAYLPGGGGNAPSGSVAMVQVTGVPAGDVLNVRSGPGTTFRIVGALGNGDTVRQLGCEAKGNARWCQIEMMTDMRERGWVNARYLTAGSAVQLPSPPSVGAGSTWAVRVRFAPGASQAELSGTLPPGATRRYVLGARKGQNFYVRLSARRSGLFYRIFNPDGSTLLDQVASQQDYRGQLWQSGDHVVEGINRGQREARYTVLMGIR